MTNRYACQLRGWTAAVFATSAAALSHVLGGGDAPHPVLIFVSLAISALVCSALARRVLSLKNLVTAVVTSEGLFHLLFSLSSGAPASMSSSAMAAGQHGGMGMGHAGHDGSMWLSHSTAAALTIVFLRYGEASAVRVLDALRMRITTIKGLVIVPIPAPSRINAAPGTRLSAKAAMAVPLPVRHHRGPPILVAAM
ncbi:hypothetical protein AAGW05_17930 [Arthrobacter sp. LAPM80]|uniref:hypothetical protein n=1 Tax=Arthrobacter sp. LAPM80 TaxID=3141788 RepID=UPI00398AF0D6